MIRLGERSYERRKAAAVEIESLMRDLHVLFCVYYSLLLENLLNLCRNQEILIEFVELLLC